MDEKLNSIDAKLDKLCSMRDDMKKLEVPILAKYHVRVAIYKQFRDTKLEPTLSPPLLAKHCTRYPFKFDRKLAVTAPSIAYWFSTSRCGLKGRKSAL